MLQVVIALQRHTGYFLIQIYLPCTLLDVLSWVGFWLNREATSDRVGLGKTQLEGEQVFSGLAKKVTISEKSTIFVRSSRNLVKITTS